MDRLAIDLSLLALVVCLAHAGWLAISLATKRWQLAASSLPTASLLGIVLALAAVASWAAGDAFSLPAVYRLVVPAALAAWSALRFGWGMRLHGRLDPHNWRVCAAAQVLLLAAAGWQFRSSTAAYPSGLELEVETLYACVPVDDAVLVTDQGRVFTLFHFDPRENTDDPPPPPPAGAAPHKLQLASQRQPAPLPLPPLRLARGDRATNCHGWVFTGGRYVLSEDAVEALLQDNGYKYVPTPQPGDVIVYRDGAGQILHSGRVRRVHSDSEVWIESKWGPGGRFVHLPQDGYSGTIEYYRSTRRSHDAQIVATHAAPPYPNTLQAADGGERLDTF